MKSPQKCMIDLDAMLGRMGGHRILVDEVIQIFEEDSPQLIDDIERAFESNEVEEISRLAHALKGLLSNFGSNECGFEVKQVELFAKSGELSLAREHFERSRSRHKELMLAIAEL